MKGATPQGVRTQARAMENETSIIKLYHMDIRILDYLPEDERLTSRYLPCALCAKRMVVISAVCSQHHYGSEK